MRRHPSPGIERLLRDLAPQALAVVTRRFGDFASRKTLYRKRSWPPPYSGPSAVCPKTPGHG